MSTADGLPDIIRSRGYWRVVVRPGEYKSNSLTRNDLESILVRSRVSLRGWDFPHISNREPIARFTDGIAQGTHWEHYREFWRFYRSGQFIYLGGIVDDWRDESSLWPGEYAADQREIGFVSTIYQFTEIFEFAARLAVAGAGGPRMRVEVAVHGLRGRRFYMDDPRRTPLFQREPPHDDEWADGWSGSRDELIADRSHLAVPMLEDLFDLFGLAIQSEVIQYHQQRLLKGSP